MYSPCGAYAAPVSRPPGATPDAYARFTTVRPAVNTRAWYRLCAFAPPGPLRDGAFATRANGQA